ncbi:hypothetical protein GCM10023216_18790 [Isoptericola chiayiensis]|uniref:ABC3 transporter permease protein domain-containing protein n=1 Tax=Isoptericola chiayiensis TaxID=579446 RepID=A0ABP8YJM1_9MICO|nr:hypothetical protein [Isoptericola chiayiensis]NOW00107.1 putative ABC transport system permease protein [Isoptericola chiayiensis]
MRAMLHLVLAELLAAAVLWVGVGAVTGTAGYTAGLVASLVTTARDLEGTSELALYGISGTAIAFTAIAIVVTVASVSELTLALLRRRFALWILAGVTPAGLTTAALTQLAIVAVLGASTGAVLAAATAGRVGGAVLAQIPTLSQVRVHLGGPGTVIVASTVVVLTACAGFRPALRAGRNVGVDPRQDPPGPPQGMGASRWIASGLTAAALASVVASVPGSVDPGTPLLLIAPLAAALLATGAPVFVARWVRHWTHLVSRNPRPTWLIARAQARELLARSSGPIGPILVTVALTGGLWAASAATHSVPGNGQAGALGLLVVLAAPLIVTLVGSAATVVMLDRGRKSTSTVAHSLGATRLQLIGTSVFEIAIIVTTSAALGTVCVGITMIAAAWTLGSDAVLAAAPGSISAIGCATVVCFAIQSVAVLPAAVLTAATARKEHHTPGRRHQEAPRGTS